MRNKLSIIFLFLSFSCSSKYKSIVRSVPATRNCRIIQQDVNIDSNILRNLSREYEKFILSNNDIDVLKLWIKEGVASNVSEYVFSEKNNNLTYYKYKKSSNEKMDLIDDQAKIVQIEQLYSISPGNFTFFCLNELPHTICFYFVKIKGKLVYKLMIEEGNEDLATKENAELGPLFKIFE